MGRGMSQEDSELDEDDEFGEDEDPWEESDTDDYDS